MDDKIKDFVNYLVNKYKFEYRFGPEDFKNGELKNVSWPNNPIVLASGKTDNNNIIGVMAFGGCIGIIDCNSPNVFLVESKVDNFVKYLGEGDNRHQDGHGNHYLLPDRFSKEYNNYFNRNYKKQDLKEMIIKECPTPETFSKDNTKKLKKCLDFLVCSAYIRFMHRSKNNIVDISERSMQTIISRKNGVEMQNSELMFIDTEFKIQIEDDDVKVNKTPSVDLVVLDRKDKAFGLIEFKYQGESMEPSSKNSLTEHYNDFKKILTKPNNKHNIIKRLKEYTLLLVELGLIRDEYLEPIINNINEIWCGFYFVENKGKKTRRQNKQMRLEDRIYVDCYTQILDIFGDDKDILKSIRIQNSDLNNLIINMTKTDNMVQVCTKHKEDNPTLYSDDTNN